MATLGSIHRVIDAMPGEMLVLRGVTSSDFDVVAAKLDHAARQIRALAGVVPDTSRRTERPRHHGRAA